MSRTTVFLVFIIASLTLAAQEDDRMAYVPRTPMKGEASSPGIGIQTQVSQGFLVLALPEDASHADLTNARGRVVASVPAWPEPRIDVRRLRSGTYMVRAHTPQGILLKRFVLMSPGGGIWLTEAPLR